MPKDKNDPVRISGVSRLRALVKVILLSVGGGLLLLPTFYVWPTLHFVPSAVSNRLTDYALAITVAVPFIAGVTILWQAMRWFLFVIWPAPMRIEADDRALTFRLGPFGTTSLDWSRMQITYAFECEDPAEVDPDLLGLEPEEEMETHLPRMRHPSVQGDVNRLFEKFANTEEPVLAARLLPHFQRMRED